MDRYTIQCTPEQTKKALKLGAPIEYASIIDIRLERYVHVDNKFYACPTAEQMIGWLEEQGISISIEYNTTNLYSVSLEGLFGYIPLGVASLRESTLAAIDAALEFLMKNKK